jgi:hypothetical protein
MRGVLQGLRPSLEQALHFIGRFQMPLGIGQQAKTCFLDRDMLADAGEDVLQRPPLRRVVEHVVGRDQRQAIVRTQLHDQAKAACVIAAIEMAGGEVRVLADVIAEALQERGKCLIDLLRHQGHKLLAKAMVQHLGIVQ